jgi:flavin-dependent dehydrogenase
MKTTYDVIVIGAGPAGSTAAAVLAAKGRRVLVLEKETFPRYHVGESLIPFCYFTLERLGLLERLSQGAFVKKYSVQFVSIRGHVSNPFYFFNHLDHPASTTWQVVRSEFDSLLMQNAQDKGAEVRQGVTVKELLEKDGQVVGVKAKTQEKEVQELYAPMTIDASGLRSFAVKKNGWRVADPSLDKIAIWTYFKNAKRDSGYDEGATTVAYLPEKGWFWYIPLHNETVSVGVVAEPAYLYREGRNPEEIIAREIQNNAWIREHLRDATQVGEYRAANDYSYRSRHCAKDGLLLTGDAFSFLDPVFSSGVFLALRGGEMAGEAVDAALANNDVSASQFAAYGDELCAGIEAMRKLVYVFYDKRFRFSDVIKKHPHLHGDLTDCLIGNVYKDFDPLFSAIEEFADVPAPLAHGQPWVQPDSAVEV